MKNKGFTVIELLASFTLTMVIVVFLFQIVLDLKDVYTNNTLEANIYHKNALVASSINDIFKDGIQGPEKDRIGEEILPACSKNKCILNTINSGLVIIEITDKTINIGDNKKIKMPDGVSIDNVNFEYQYIFGEYKQDASETAEVSNDANPDKDNAYIKLTYDVVSDDLIKPITFNCVYTYHELIDYYSGGIVNP